MCDVICNEAVPFRPYCAGVATRTRNVSKYMLVLALCPVLKLYTAVTNVLLTSVSVVNLYTNRIVVYDKQYIMIHYSTK